MDQAITIRISQDMRKELEEFSKFVDKPVSEIVRESLKKSLTIYRFRKLRNMVLPFAEAQGILTDEDVFEMMK